MKRTVLFFFMVLLVVAIKAQQPTPPSASDILNKAYQQAAKDNYVICHLVTDESKDKKNLENPGAAEMKIKYNGEGLGIPFWLVFDKDGNLLSDSKMRKEGEGPEKGENAGCPATEKEVDFFVEVLKKTSRLNADQLEIIRSRFRENDK